MADPRTPPSPTVPPRGALDPFLQAVLRSRLLDRARLDAALAAAPAPARSSPRALADHLTAVGELSHYQAEKLLQGLWQGLVLGPYHVLAPLGRGGMGTVYLARDTRVVEEEEEGESGRTGEGETRRGGEGEKRGTVGDSSSPPLRDAPSPALSSLVALKVLPPKRAREEEKTLLRFRREMDLGRHVAHPNITRTFDAGVIDGVHYIAMEYVPGQSLRQVVVRGGPLSVPDAARVFADVASGLSHAHARGLIHRDLKPSNIMVTPEGRAKVLDLGLAILMDEALPADPTIVGGQGYILGTMDYIAPEQAADATDVGPWSDLYAAGCSLYFALTGMPPFPGGTAQQKMRWHRTETPPPIAQFNPAVPPEFARLVDQLMAKRPEDRPPSAWAVRNLLLPWAADTVSRAAAGPAPHTDREAVAEVDTRAFDPSLWDAAPLPDAAAGSPAREQADAAVARRQAVLMGLAAGGVALGLAALAVLFGLLRRL